MKEHHILIPLLFFVLSIGLIAAAPAVGQVYTETERITLFDTEIEVIKTADNFIILYDSSGSMGKAYEGGPMSKLEMEKLIIKEHVDKLPELNWNAGLYSHTPGTFSFSASETYYEMKPFNKAAFSEAVEKLPTKPTGPTMLNDVLQKLNKALENLDGRTVIFLFTDGKQNIKPDQRTSLEIAQEMARKFDVCFYLISTTDEETQRWLIDKVSTINECSRVVSFEDIWKRPAYTAGALYVIQEKLAPNFEIRKQNVLFDFDQSDIKAEFRSELNTVGDFLEKTPDAYVVLAGYTDTSGDATYNMQLSRMRAESVAEYLHKSFDIQPGQVVLFWYGGSNPVATNNTYEGRQRNRRVECYLCSGQ